MAAAGPQLQRECSRKYPNGVQQGDVAVTSSYGNLACQCVYHGACVNWDNGKGQSEQVNIIYIYGYNVSFSNDYI